MAPCLVKNVEIWENTIPYTKHVAQIGTSSKTDLASSTSAMVHTLASALEEYGTSSALSRNLKQYERNKSYEKEQKILVKHELLHKYKVERHTVSEFQST